MNKLRFRSVQGSKLCPGWMMKGYGVTCLPFLLFPFSSSLVLWPSSAVTNMHDPGSEVHGSFVSTGWMEFLFAYISDGVRVYLQHGNGGEHFEQKVGVILKRWRKGTIWGGSSLNKYTCGRMASN